MQIQGRLKRIVDRFFVKPSQAVPEFLVMLPIHRRPHLLKFAIASVLGQTEQDFQLHVISDGAPEETTEELNKISQRHKKVTVHIFPKAERNGEIYRDQIIGETQSQFICQIADDDIWFPNHLQQIRKLLKTADFGNTIQVEAAPEYRLLPLIGDLSDAKTVSKMIHERFNIFGPSASGYLRTAYEKLNEGWTPAPQDIWSDLHMWRKFLNHIDIKYATRFRFTNLHVGSPHHVDLSIEEREIMNRDWWDIVRNPSSLDQLTEQLTQHAMLKKEGWFTFQHI